MNTPVLVKTLSSITNDANKNVTLKTIIVDVTGMQWSDISTIISCYSSDSAKNDAISIIVTNNKFSGSCENYLVEILRTFSSDSGKVSAVKILAPFVKSIDKSTLVSILREISCESSKTAIIKTFAGLMDNLTGSDLSIILAMIDDSAKSDVVYALRNKINPMTCDEITTMFKTISRDSTKMHCLKSVPMQTPTLITVIPMINCFSHDRDKVVALKFFVHHGFAVDANGLLTVCNNISAPSYQLEAITELSKVDVPIENQEQFCQDLAKIFSHPDYLKAATKLNLDANLIEKYKPKTATTTIDGKQAANIDIGKFSSMKMEPKNNMWVTTYTYPGNNTIVTTTPKKSSIADLQSSLGELVDKYSKKSRIADLQSTLAELADKYSFED